MASLLLMQVCVCVCVWERERERERERPVTNVVLLMDCRRCQHTNLIRLTVSVTKMIFEDSIIATRMPSVYCLWNTSSTQLLLSSLSIDCFTRRARRPGHKLFVDISSSEFLSLDIRIIVFIRLYMELTLPVFRFCILIISFMSFVS